jgi:hypothetical protein
MMISKVRGLTMFVCYNIAVPAASGRAIRALDRGRTIKSLGGLIAEQPLFVCGR